MIYLYNELQKSKKPYPEIIRKLRAMLEREEPELIKFTARALKNQQNCVSYQDLRKAIIKGELDKRIFKEWNQEYSKFINEKLYPKWLKAMKEGTKNIKEKKVEFFFDVNFDLTQKWLDKHGAELVVQITDTQRQAVNALIKKAVYFQGSPDSLAMLIRPTIGLYKGQAIANYNYYTAIYNGFLKANPRMRKQTAEKRATEAAAKYAEKQHRYRAMNIARTELAFAYNAGEHYGIKQAQSEGLMGKTMKCSSSAGDTRVCEDCQNLDGTEVYIDENFSNGFLIPPYHPSCRCCVEYIEIEAPRFY